MGNLRPVLAIGLVFLGYMLWVEWQKDYGPRPMPAESVSVSDTRGQSVPSVPEQAAEDLPRPTEAGSTVRQNPEDGVPAVEAPAVMTGESPFIRVVTDVLEAEIDLMFKQPCGAGQ